tara:strand:+ start:7156 stop:8496 length:1341 start_codon:yes stop_codon:yes gene_type:complete
MKLLLENWRKFINEEKEISDKDIEKLKKIKGELENASKMHKGQAERIGSIINDLINEQDITEEEITEILSGLNGTDNLEEGHNTDPEDLQEAVSIFLEMKEDALEEKRKRSRRKTKAKRSRKKSSKKSKPKDACYHKVKARYDVWPSAYASGALVKCRKVGASNWGTGGKKKNEAQQLTEKKNCGCGQDPCKTYGKVDENKRIPRKKGQPAKSKKHSDLYTDEDPKGTIHGLGFKDESTARASVSKIRNSSRSHAHKTQAAIAMEQRAKAAGKSAEAAIFRKFIEQQKKKTKAKKDESLSLEQIVQEEMEAVLNEKCWPGYEKKGMKTMFGKRYPNCVKKTNEDVEENVDLEEEIELDEERLDQWFKGGGWKQAGGKYDGKPCARQPGQKTTPKCVSRSKFSSMSPKERESAGRRKRKKDPGQPKKTGAAKPTYVKTDPEKKRKKK